MWLVLQIALGMLVGYILIENRKQIFDAAGGFAILAIFAAFAAVAIFVLTYVGGSTIDAVRDYESADWIGRKVFFGIGLVVFLVLVVSMVAGLWLFFCSLTPMWFRAFCQRKGQQKAPSILALLFTISAVLAGSAVALPAAVRGWESAWTNWGLAHGMGYDGGAMFDLLLWQLIWIPTGILLRLRGWPQSPAPVENV